MSTSLLNHTERFDGQIVEVALNAPPANILTAQMMTELRELLAAEREVSARKALILTGSGEHFCYGASVAEHQADQVGDMLPAFHALIDELLDYPIATIARVRGRCLGGGFELALGCSLVFADDSARFAVPEIQLGVFPPVAAVLLPHLAGAALAPRMIIGAEQLTAAELDRFGVLAGGVGSEDLNGLVDDWIGRHLLPLSAASLRRAQRAARVGVVAHFRAHIGAVERLYLNDLMATHDANEGIAAFVQRREPEWKDA